MKEVIATNSCVRFAHIEWVSIIKDHFNAEMVKD